MKKLKPKVTVASVRRQWQEKFAQLDLQYSILAERNAELARVQDVYLSEKVTLSQALNKAQDLATDRLITIHQLEGVIMYLEGKNGTNN